MLFTLFSFLLPYSGHAFVLSFLFVNETKPLFPSPPEASYSNIAHFSAPQAHETQDMPAVSRHPWAYSAFSAPQAQRMMKQAYKCFFYITILLCPKQVFEKMPE
ncbi:MAG: hypothetical protein SPI28_04495 [Acetatifactor sp.]|nr:hypothetical protein [Acetatifactor sp.]